MTTPRFDEEKFFGKTHQELAKAMRDMGQREFGPWNVDIDFRFRFKPDNRSIEWIRPPIATIKGLGETIEIVESTSSRRDDIFFKAAIALRELEKERLIT